MLDTGATNSGIKASLAQALGIRAIGRRPLLSVHGLAHVDRYIFRVGLAIQDDMNGTPRFPFVFEEIEGFALANGASFDALLGMDILSQCDLHLPRDGRGNLAFG